MIYTDWKDIAGKTIEKVEKYYQSSEYNEKHWIVLFFNDGVLIQEFTDIYYEGGNLFIIDTTDGSEPQEVIDIINNYKD